MKDISTKPIKIKVEYKLALQQIYPLMSAEEGTKEIEALETLSILIEDYEEKHFPIDSPIHTTKLIKKL